MVCPLDISLYYQRSNTQPLEHDKGGAYPISIVFHLPRPVEAVQF